MSLQLGDLDVRLSRRLRHAVFRAAGEDQLRRARQIDPVTDADEKRAGAVARPQNQAILAFLETEIGLEALRRKDYVEAVRRFSAAIDLDPRAVPAYLNLGDVRVAEGDEREAAAIWERVVDVAPDRAYLAFDRLEALAVRTGNPERFTRLCRRLIDDNPQDWRARLALSRHLVARGRPSEALDLLFAALVQNPHALSIHQAIWRSLGALHHPPSLVNRYSELTELIVAPAKGGPGRFDRASVFDAYAHRLPVA